MATPKSIPCKFNTAASQVSASSGKKIYITGLLKSGGLTIDGVSIGTVGPVNLSSPICCDTFTPTAAGQVAYFEK
jgi:hypothetical protein